MSSENGTREETAARLTYCGLWLASFGVLAGYVNMLVGAWCTAQLECGDLEAGRALMAQQMDQLRRGEIHCLSQPDPRLIDELLADTTYAANVHDLYLGGDVSDQRLGRLRELPNLSCIVFVLTCDADSLLEHLQGMTTIEQLTFEHTGLARRGMESIRSFPCLKSLCLPAHDSSALEPIEEHPCLESIVLSGIKCDDSLLSFLQRLPRLRSVTVEDAEIENKEFEETLRESLPDCQCVVRGPSR